MVRPFGVTAIQWFVALRLNADRHLLLHGQIIKNTLFHLFMGLLDRRRRQRMAAWREASTAIAASRGGGLGRLGVGWLLLTDGLLFASKFTRSTTNPPFLHVDVGPDFRIDRVSLDHLCEG